jgi:hypothetical protein
MYMVCWASECTNLPNAYEVQCILYRLYVPIRLKSPTKQIKIGGVIQYNSLCSATHTLQQRITPEVIQKALLLTIIT